MIKHILTSCIVLAFFGYTAAQDSYTVLPIDETAKQLIISYTDTLKKISSDSSMKKAVITSRLLQMQQKAFDEKKRKLTGILSNIYAGVLSDNIIRPTIDDNQITWSIAKDRNFSIETLDPLIQNDGTEYFHSLFEFNGPSKNTVQQQLFNYLSTMPLYGKIDKNIHSLMIGEDFSSFYSITLESTSVEDTVTQLEEMLGLPKRIGCRLEQEESTSVFTHQTFVIDKEYYAETTGKYETSSEECFGTAEDQPFNSIFPVNTFFISPEKPGVIIAVSAGQAVQASIELFRVFSW